MRDAFGPGREHPADEDLLELALRPARGHRIHGLSVPGPRSTGQHLEACPSCRERLEDLCGFTGRVRSMLMSEVRTDSPEVQSLRARVLNATTREDLGWRGDLRLVGRFLGERLRTSAWARVAAASLFIHLAALPVLAWVFLASERERGFQTDVIPPPPPGPLETDEPRWEPQPMDFAAQPPDAGTPPDPRAATLAQKNALGWARWQLSQGDVPSVGDPPTTALGRLLARRAEVILGRADALPTPPTEPSEQPSSWLFEVLEAEIELDRLVLAGAGPERSALRTPPRITRLASEWLTTTDVVRRDRPLLLALLHRASGYGLLSQVQDQALREFERSASGRATPEALKDPLRPDAPLDSAWIMALEQALPLEAKNDPVVRAWLSWRL